MAGAAGGLLILASLFLLLGELGEDQRRIGGILISLAFEALGVLLLVSNRHKRAATSGVVVTAIGVIPLLVYLFVDVKDPGRTIDSVGSFTRTATIVLLVAAALWLVAFFFGPGRRYGFYLGAALIAIWLVSVVQIVDQPLGQLASGFGPFGSTSTFTTVGPSIGPSDSFDDSDFDDEFDSSDPFDDSDFDSSEFDRDFERRFPSEDDLPSPENPSTKLGIASLLFGGAYLAAARWRDRRADGRTATVFFATAIPILTFSVLFLSDALNTVGASLLGLALSAAAVWIAAPRGRRFTSWYATVTAIYAVVTLVDNGFGDSNRAMAAVLGLLGVGLALLASRLPHADEGEPAASTDPSAGTPAGGTLPSPSPSASSDPSTATQSPTAAPWPPTPPAGPSGWAPPTPPS